MDKPAYRVPSMREIDALPWNGLTAASTFSGCGGSSLGYRMAGFRVLYANEFIPAAQTCYRANAPACALDPRDIRHVTASEILDACKLNAGELDLLDGSPPCAAFSTLGKRHKHWGKSKKYSDTAQRSDDLFYEFLRIVREIQPRAFVAENVSGLVKGTSRGYFLQILEAMTRCGYRVRCKLLDAQWLGVPQARQRTIFIGARADLQVTPQHPAPLPYRYSVRDVLPHVVTATFKKGGLGYFTITDKPSLTITASQCAIYLQTRPSPHGALTRRQITIDELKLLCGFPEDFVLTGSYPQQWERLGRAVPPLMMERIARAVRDHVLRDRFAQPHHGHEEERAT